MTKEEALQQIEEYKKPLDRATATFGNIVDDYYTTSEVLEITRNQIVSSLRKKGLPLVEGAKLSEVPPEILKLPTLEKKLEIIPPNPDAVIDKFDGEFDVTNINVNYSPNGTRFGFSSPYNSKVAVYTDNYIAWSVSTREILYKRYDDVSFKSFTTPAYDTNNFCSAHDGDRVYSFNSSGTSNVMNIHVYDLSDTNFTSPKETYPINDCNSVLWCDTIDGVITLLYKSSNAGTLYFGTYVLGEDFITRKTGTNGNILTDVSYDDKYFYLALGNSYVHHVDRALTFESTIRISVAGTSNIRRITPIGDKLIVHDGSTSVHLRSGIDSSEPLKPLYNITSNFCDFSVAIDDTHFIASYNSRPYARLIRLVESSGSYSQELVGNFYDINTSTMTYPGMIIAKDLFGKQYLVFTRYRSILVEGIDSEYEFELERRN